MLFSACASQETPQTSKPRREVTDGIGRKVSLPTRIERAVSLAPSATESIFAVGAGNRLVGVTTFCNYPAEAIAIPKVGDTMNPSIETIVALKPDVVFVSTASQIEAFTKTLEQNGIAVYVTNPETLADVLDDLARLGDLFGTTQIAKKKVEELQTRAAAVEAAVQGKEPIRAFVQISKEPLFTVGRQSFLTELLGKAGAQSVTADVGSAYPKLSKESAIALNPEAIILSDSEDNREPNEVFRGSAAVKSGKVFRVDADLLSRPGPRLVDALEQIAKALHPDMFVRKADR